MKLRILWVVIGSGSSNGCGNPPPFSDVLDSVVVNLPGGYECFNTNFVT